MTSKIEQLAARAQLTREATLKPSAAVSPMSTFEAKNEMAQNGDLDYFTYAEITRICGLPLILPMDSNELEAYNQLNVLGSMFDQGFRLFPIQAEAVQTYEMFGGCFGPIGVGWGKTLIGLMIASKAFAKGIQKMLLCVPSQVMDQLLTTDIKWARTKVSINYPIHVLGGKPKDARMMLARSGKKGLYIMPYSQLSTEDATHNLLAIQPQIIIFDECHNVSKRSAARTKRIMEFITKHKPEIAALSGTITHKSIKDYFHLIKAALGENNPLPNSASLANDWAMLIDATATTNGEASNPTASGPLLPLVVWAQQRFPHENIQETIAGFRRAYRLRMNSAPGVVASGDAEIGTSLILANCPVQDYKKSAGWETLDKYGRQVTDMWLTPNGDEIEHAIHCWKWLFELYGAGFFNELSWPTTEVYAKRKTITEAQAEETLAKAAIHHAALQVYHKTLRRWLDDNARASLDTPFLVGQDMARHKSKNVGTELYETWAFAKALDFEGRPDRDSKAVRVCSFKIDAAVSWGRDTTNRGKGAILWVYHQEVGAWVYDELFKAGLPCLHCPAGEAHNVSILDPKNRDRLIVTSMSAHGTGKNLQHFSEQYYVQWPRQATMAEQTLGRTHRNGQLADELIVHQNLTTEFDTLNFAACLNDSLYIHQTTGNRQKLIYATYNPLPKVFPSAVLIERGMQNKLLTRDQQRIIDEKFNPQ